MPNGEGHQLLFSNIAQQDQLMGSPDFSRSTDSPSTLSSSYSSQQYPSPILSTPGLSYSPSSTESSSSDRTIQMSSFMDDTMAPPLSHDVVVVSGGTEMASHWGPPTPRLHCQGLRLRPLWVSRLTLPTRRRRSSSPSQLNRTSLRRPPMVRMRGT